MYRILIFLCFISQSVVSSDHADTPLNNMSRNDIKLTGLLSFVDKDQLVVIIGSNPLLNAEQGYQFPTDVDFNLNLDFDANVSFDNKQHNQLYGGTINTPKNIKQDLTIRIKFNKKQNLSDENSFTTQIITAKDITQQMLKIEALVRDDPFTFPSFHGQNIAAIVISIPLKAVSMENTQHVLIWSTITETSSDDGRVILEHVGRALRSQIAGQQALNLYPPSKQTEKTGLVTDVMIYRLDQPALLPNGRALKDDTLSILCAAADEAVCELLAKAKAGNYNPSYTGQNDKAFLPLFPYLAAPH